MKVTVCQLRDDAGGFAQDWELLVAHTKAEASQVVLLPEMPFYPWIASTHRFDPATWKAAIQAHDDWLKRLDELAPAMVLSTRPVNKEGKRLNEGFAWVKESGYRGVHHKFYLPEEEGFWEASWYQRGEGDFSICDYRGLRLGFLICTELWFMERARAYGKSGAQMIVSPRASAKATVDKWLLAGRTAAIVSGAFSLSSNRIHSEGQSPEFGGQGWVIDSEGQVLGLTSRQQPIITVEIDLAEADLAKDTYPRYVQE